MTEEIVTTETTETEENVIINLLTEIQSGITMLTEQITALTPVQDKGTEEITEEITEEKALEKVEVEPEGTTDDTTEELSPEEVEKMLFAK